MKRLLVICLLFVSLATDCFAQQSAIDTDLLSICYTLWKDSAFGRDPNRTERAAWILPGDLSKKYMVLRWRRSGGRNTEFWHGAIPVHALAQVHTHTVMADPRPASMDIDLSKRIGISVYTVSGSGIWVALPSGQILQVKDSTWYKELN